MPRPFGKPWLTYAEQIALLTSRGLAVADLAAAEAFLSHVNYYRLSGYCLAFEADRHVFLPGTTLAQLRDVYDFDFSLRDLLGEALEVVEVDLRTAVAHHFGDRHGPFGHTNVANFYGRPRFRHDEWLASLQKEAERSKELFVRHFRRSYDEWPNLPIWAATELMSFGTLSVMVAGMLDADRTCIAARYSVEPRILESWSHHLSYVRNLCAHHARVWDKHWSIAPRLPNDTAWRPPHLSRNTRVAATLLILAHMLKGCPLAGPFLTPWRDRVDALLASPPACPGAAGKLGLSPGWASGPGWC